MHALKGRAPAALGAVLILFGYAASGCSKRVPPTAPLTPEDCARLVDRYGELITSDAAARAQIHEQAKTELEACTHDVSRAGYECAMRAPDPDAFEECLRR